MARKLPSFPLNGVATNADLQKLVRELEHQLSRKANLIDGRVYATDEQPLVVLDDEGTVLRLGRDVIPPMQPAGDYQPAGNYAAADHNHDGVYVRQDGDSGWQTPVLQNGWVDYGGGYGPPRYRKLSSGLVVMEGLLQSGAVGTTVPMFTLPVGYRPRVTLIMHPKDSAGTADARIDIRPDGMVTAHTVSPGWVSICFCFMASQ